jgi:large subunit ribosomal protein L15
MDLQRVRRVSLGLPKKFRLGIGTSSGNGKTSGRGQKGQGARSGESYIVYFEGGQMPLPRKLPKRGFNNKRFSPSQAHVSLSQLERLFADGDKVDPASLTERGLTPPGVERIKILGGTLSRKLQVRAHAFSASAKAGIEKAGGSIEPIAFSPRIRRASNVRLGLLESKFKDGDVVDPAALAAAGILRSQTGRPVKFVKGGVLTRKLTVKAHRFSRQAAEAIRRAGGEPILLS